MNWNQGARLPEIKILDTKDMPFIIINKPSGLPSAPINSQDKENALMKAAELFPQILKVKGKKEIEYGLLHRLDTVTSGLLLIATTQDFYDYMIEQQKEEKFSKYYSAKCQIKEDNWKFLEGMGEPEFSFESSKNSYLKTSDFPPPAETVIKVSSYFRHFGKNNAQTRPVTEKSSSAALKKLGKKVIYTTEVRILSVDLINKTCRVECRITKGFKHQVRCHLSWIGLPVIDDPIYNADFCKKENYSNSNKEKSESPKISFCAGKIEFFYPENKLNAYSL